MNPSRADALAKIGAIVGSSVAVEFPRIARAKDPDTVRVGASGVEGNAQVLYALEQGFFKQNGLNVQFTIMRGGQFTMEGVASGELEAGAASSAALGTAILKKIPYIVIAPGVYWDAAHPNTGIVVAAGSPVKGAKDLNGATIGVQALGSADSIGVQAYMDRNGGDSRTIRFIEVPFSAAADTVTRGTVQATVLTEPQLSIALASGKVRTLAWAYDSVAKLFYSTVWFSSNAWLAQNKDAARRFAEAVSAGGAWAESHRPQALDILDKYLHLREARSQSRYGRKLDPAQLQPIWDACYQYKLFSGPLRAADYCWTG